MSAQNDLINNTLLDNLSKYLRLTNYLGAAQMYLQDNFLLKDKLKKEHIKKRVLGHWGTVPGINFIYANLNILALRYKQEIMFIAGPGHGYPALLANLYVEGSFGEIYKDYQFGEDSFGRLIKNFSWPGGFPSHANPETPGIIMEGGELGYALSTSFGAAFDNPDLIVAAVIGDGEAETGPTATAWHSNKFLNPKTDGAVLPIIHLNQYKISGPTIYGTMSDDELIHLFKGLGYDPLIVQGEFLYEPMLRAIDEAYSKIKSIQDKARKENIIDKPAWPVIIIKSKKGWTGPKTIHGKQIEGTFRSHGVPLENVLEDDTEFQVLEDWLKSYNVQELITENFDLIPEIKSLIPEKKYRLGMNKHANGGLVIKPLNLPPLIKHEFEVLQSTKVKTGNMHRLADYLKEVIELNPDNFRILSPDETESNRLNALFEATKRGYIWPTLDGAENVSFDGRIMEMLSEHTLQGWMQGYAMTGRYSIFISYEAFLMIIASMVDQYAKFLIQSQKFGWRKPVPSLNYVLTSTSWRQDHNGFSHQNPGFVSNLLNKHSNIVNIHFPPDANTLIATAEDCFKSVGKINVIVVGKRSLPQYLTMAEAKRQIELGVDRWSWAGNNDKDPDVVFASTGDYATQETMAAIKILKEIAPELKTRYIAISELTCFGIGDSRNQSKLSSGKFTELFTPDREIIYSYHGYPEDIKQLIFGHKDSNKFKIFGYTEKGTTTTPFDMLVKNRCSRYDLAREAVKSASKINPAIHRKLKELENYFEAKLLKHTFYIREYGQDIPEITNFEF